MKRSPRKGEKMALTSVQIAMTLRTHSHRSEDDLYLQQQVQVSTYGCQQLGPDWLMLVSVVRVGTDSFLFASVVQRRQRVLKVMPCFVRAMDN